MCRKTIEDLIKELDFTQEQMEKYPEKYVKHNIAEIMFNHNEYSKGQIQHNCINNKCNKHKIINYNGYNLHACYDDWSFIEVGWHVITFETLDLCFEYKIRKENE